VLRTSGNTFDVDAFLRASALVPLTVFHRGELQFPASDVSQRRNEHSGMNVGVSTREFADLGGQLEDAIQFLTNNNEELRRLREFAGVERMELDFPVEDRDVVFQRDSFPPLLLSLLGGRRVGLVVSRYPAPDGR
jgi:hypothetical protein